MNGHILDFVKSAHRNVQELLPWYLTGKLDDDQRVAVELHLRTCEACRLDLQWQRGMQDSYLAGASTVADVDRSFARLQKRLDAPQGLAQRIAQGARTTLGGALVATWGWQRYALVAQLALIVVLGWALAARDVPVAGYRTLSAAPLAIADAATIVVVFDPQLRESDVRRIIRGARARLVGGPTDADAYLLAVDPRAQTQTLRQLRSEQGVRLAEALSTRPAP